ncbi:unnamed protein product [Merluccius merluccius]
MVHGGGGGVGGGGAGGASSSNGGGAFSSASTAQGHHRRATSGSHETDDTEQPSVILLGRDGRRLHIDVADKGGHYAPATPLSHAGTAVSETTAPYGLTPATNGEPVPAAPDLVRAGVTPVP